MSTVAVDVVEIERLVESAVVVAVVERLGQLVERQRRVVAEEVVFVPVAGALALAAAAAAEFVGTQAAFALELGPDQVVVAAVEAEPVVAVERSKTEAAPELEPLVEIAAVVGIRVDRMDSDHTAAVAEVEVVAELLADTVAEGSSSLVMVDHQQ